MDPNQVKIIRIAVTVVIGIAILIAAHYFMNKIVKKSDKIHRRFLGKLLNLIVVIACLVHIIEEIDPSRGIYSTMLKGSALIVAILGCGAAGNIGSDMRIPYQYQQAV